MMEIESCYAKIQSQLSSFTNAEKKIAQYILANYKDTLHYTITELAEKVDTSEASVVRFCRSLGFKGYQSLKISMARDVVPAVSYLNLPLEPSDTPADICKKVFHSEIAVLQDTLASLDMDMVKRAAELVVQAKRIEVFGSGGSAFVGMDMQHKLLKVGMKCFAHCDADMQAMSASLLSADDVAIGISHSGSNQSVVRCMQLAKQQGAHTLVLTTQGKSPLLKLADVVLFSSTKETAFKSESVSARIAQLALVDALVAVVALQNYQQSQYAIEQTRKATSDRKF